MRLIHTSDWHLGKGLYGYSRARDHQKAIESLLVEARDYRPDLILHTGDLFDTFSPPVAVMEMATEYLQRLAEVAPVAVVRGNHDSPRLFRFLERALGGDRNGQGYPGLRFFDEVRQASEGGIQHYPVSSTRREQRIRLFPLPFVNAFRKSEKPERFFEEARQGAEEGWLSEYERRVNDACRLIDEELVDESLGYKPGVDMPIYAAHLMVEGSKVSGSERTAHTTGDYVTDPGHSPSNALYSAFGHVHRPQKIAGYYNTQYAGSTIEMDFGEAGEQKGAVFVEKDGNGPVSAEFKPLDSGEPLVKLEGSLEKLSRLAREGEGSAGYIWATVHTEKPTRDLAARVAAIFPEARVVKVAEECEARKLRVLSSDKDNERASGEDGHADTLQTLFAEYLKEVGVRKGSGVSAAEVREAFEKSAAEDIV